MPLRVDSIYLLREHEIDFWGGKLNFCNRWCLKLTTTKFEMNKYQVILFEKNYNTAKHGLFRRKFQKLFFNYVYIQFYLKYILHLLSSHQSHSHSPSLESNIWISRMKQNHPFFLKFWWLQGCVSPNFLENLYWWWFFVFHSHQNVVWALVFFHLFHKLPYLDLNMIPQSTFLQDETFFYWKCNDFFQVRQTFLVFHVFADLL